MKFSSELLAAKKAAILAGNEIMKIYFRNSLNVVMKEDRSEVTEADKVSSDIIIKILSDFNYEIICEETKNRNLTDQMTWVVDPLDGTKDFIHKNGEFVVMIGLMKNYEPILGVVYKPVSNELFFAEKSKGAFLEKVGVISKISVSNVIEFEYLKILTSRNHLSYKEKMFINYLGKDRCFQMGSIGLKFSEISRGNYDFYFNFDGAYIWDICAPQIILEEAGGLILDINMSKLSYESIRFSDGLLVGNSVNCEVWDKVVDFNKNFINHISSSKSMDGKLIWITGLAGSGKTTLAKKLCTLVKNVEPNTVFLDGDMIREILGNDFGHTVSDRKKTAFIYARLANELVKQGLNVIISTISLFHEIHDFNANNNNSYYEILLTVDENELVKRNKKKLYTHGQNVVGIHQTPEFPRNPFLVLKNNDDAELDRNVDLILKKIF